MIKGNSNRRNKVNHTSHVKIGHEFFTKIRNDYADWHWALVREFAQNCIDAPGSTEISFTVNDNKLEVKNNGKPMTYEELTNKLLTLGGSNKDFNETVGGFGVAKSLLYYSNRSYEIYTGQYKVVGAGSDYTITDDNEPIHGTISTIELDNITECDLEGECRRFISMCSWNGVFKFNGEDLNERLQNLYYRKDLDFCKIYTLKSKYPNKLIVRIGGIPMFTSYCRYDEGCIVIELKGKSGDTLLSSRDSLKREYNNQLNEFITKLVTDKNEALRPKPNIRRARFDGPKIVGKIKKELPKIDNIIKSIPDNIKALNSNVLTNVLEDLKDASYDDETEFALNSNTSHNHRKILASVVTLSRIAKSSHQPINKSDLFKLLPAEFHISNETDINIPKYYIPGSQETYARTVADRWFKLLLEIACITDNVKPFAIGFTFSDYQRGSCECKPSWSIIMVNPVKIKRHYTTTTFEKAYKFTPAGIYDFISVAIHEFAHHIYGYDKSHDEEYAAILTDLIAKLLPHKSSLYNIFNTKVEWGS